MRLQEALLQTTWQQTELDMQSDLESLQVWAGKFNLWASQQACKKSLLFQCQPVSASSMVFDGGFYMFL